MNKPADPAVDNVAAIQKYSNKQLILAYLYSKSKYAVREFTQIDGGPPFKAEPEDFLKAIGERNISHVEAEQICDDAIKEIHSRFNV